MKRLLLFLLAPCALSAAEKLPNPLIDYQGYRDIVAQVEPIRETRRLTEEQFAAAAREPGTVLLDARSADKFALRHLKGAVSLPFTDFTAESLAQAIPTKATRVLIYCNNNFLGAPGSMASKSARASLNISTYVALAIYGYNNVYELLPLRDVRASKLEFEGTEVTAPVKAVRPPRDPRPATPPADARASSA